MCVVCPVCVLHQLCVCVCVCVVCVVIVCSVCVCGANDNCVEVGFEDSCVCDTIIKKCIQ